jgi:hypothetical protein
VVLLTCRRFGGLVDDMAKMLDLFVICSPRVGIENGDRGAEAIPAAPPTVCPTPMANPADSLAEVDIRALDVLTVDQPFSNELDTCGLSANFE